MVTRRPASVAAVGLLALSGALVALPAAAPSASAASPPPSGTVRGTVHDADDPSDPAAPGVQARLYRWDPATSVFAAVPVDPDVSDPDGTYAFEGVGPGCYTVRFADTTMTYVPVTWPSASGAAPTSPETGTGSGVVEVPDPSQPTQCNAEPTPSTPGSEPTPLVGELDVTVLKQLSNEGTTPDVTGYRHVGYRLSATPGGWNVPASTLDFAWQWQRVDSLGVARDIAGATGSSYLLTAADVGNGVRVRATASRAGYARESGYSDETEVKRGYSATGLRLASSRIRTTARGRVRVTVTPSTIPPTGTVVVKVDGRRRVSTTLSPRQEGSVALLLPRLARGKHRVVASYAGFRGLYPSTSLARTLTVVR